MADKKRDPKYQDLDQLIQETYNTGYYAAQMLLGYQELKPLHARAMNTRNDLWDALISRIETAEEQRGYFKAIIGEMEVANTELKARVTELESRANRVIEMCLSALDTNPVTGDRTVRTNLQVFWSWLKGEDK